MGLQHVADELVNGHINACETNRKCYGWEETKGELLSDDVAKEVSRFAKHRISPLVQSNAFQQLLQKEPGSDATVDLLTHSQIVLGKYLGGGGCSSIYAVQSMEGMSIHSTSSHSSDTWTEEKSNEEGESKQEYEEVNDKYVVKVLRSDLLDEESDESTNAFACCAADIVKEGILMASLDHPNILKSRALSSTGISSFAETNRHDCFFVVMGLLDETLEDRISLKWKPYAKRLKYSRILQSRRSEKRSFFKTRLEFALQLADALAYLHRHCILHRDLKPSNIGFDSKGILKVFDFDMATPLPARGNKQQQSFPSSSNSSQLQHDPNEDRFLLSQCAGSLRYMSPECGKGERYNLKSDVYSFALILHQVLSLKTPYDEWSSKEQVQKVFFQGLRPEIPSKWPKSLHTLLAKAWAQDFSTRPTMEEIFTDLSKMCSRSE